jgi:transcriptional regulator with GAF, ATPase, and Fis domain
MRLGSIARECSCARIDALTPMRDFAAHNRAPYSLSHSMPSRIFGEMSKRFDEENFDLREEIVSTSMFEKIVGSSEAISRVTAQVKRVAPSDATALITGESGTGKELIARAIHRRSAVRGCPSPG